MASTGALDRQRQLANQISRFSMNLPHSEICLAALDSLVRCTTTMQCCLCLSEARVRRMSGELQAPSGGHAPTALTGVQLICDSGATPGHSSASSAPGQKNSPFRRYVYRNLITVHLFAPSVS